MRVGSGSASFDGRIAGAALFSRKLSTTELAQWEAGPEPLNTVAPTLTISTTTWTGTIGTWDSQSNGTLTYAWELRDADDDSVVESGTGSSPSGSGSYSGAYYLWVRASNDGGYDTAEDSVSADQTATGGGVNASLTATDGADTLVATSTVSLSALLTATDGSDTLSATATVALQATLSATDGTDALSATTAVQASASLTSTDGSDTLAASATVSISASATVTDGADTLEFTAVGVAQASAVLNATDGADSLSATATVGVSSTLSQTDGSDSLSASATVSISAALTATDGVDSLTFTATSGGSVIGGIYLGQVVCYSQTVVVNRNAVVGYRNSVEAV
jgi:hypothetical protein